MVRIAAHHKNDPYEPKCDWPNEVYVQWGGNGLVLSGDDSAYATAFFEAFPKDNASGFIRGEGSTIADAESAAFSQWRRQVNHHHVHWRRRGYTNGLGFCADCGASKTVFKPIYKIGEWRKPVSPSENWLLEESPNDIEDKKARRYHRKLWLRRKLFGVSEPGHARGIEKIFERILVDTA